MQAAKAGYDSSGMVWALGYRLRQTEDEEEVFENWYVDSVKDSKVYSVCEVSSLREIATDVGRSSEALRAVHGR